MSSSQGNPLSPIQKDFFIQVELLDRSLQPGDVVRHATNPHQRGYVKDVQITADIRILGTDKIIKNVDCTKYISPLQVNRIVYCQLI